MKSELDLVQRKSSRGAATRFFSALLAIVLAKGMNCIMPRKAPQRTLSGSPLALDTLTTAILWSMACFIRMMSLFLVIRSAYTVHSRFVVIDVL